MSRHERLVYGLTDAELESVAEVVMKAKAWRFGNRALYETAERDAKVLREQTLVRPKVLRDTYPEEGAFARQSRYQRLLALRPTVATRDVGGL
jgi:hypothetical protein